MRLTVVLVAIIGLLTYGVAQDSNGDLDISFHYALDKNCHLFISKTAESLKSFISDPHDLKTPEMDCTKAYIAYAPPTSETSLFVFLPHTADQMYIYGRNFKADENIMVDVGSLFELVDFKDYVATGQCWFNLEGNFVAFFDKNHLYLGVDCVSEHSFIVTQAVSYLHTVWMPAVNKVKEQKYDFLQKLGIGTNVAAFPAAVHNSVEESDSGIAYYSVTGTTLTAYVAPLHRLRQRETLVRADVQTLEIGEAGTGFKRLYFVTSKFFILQTADAFYPYVQGSTSAFNQIFTSFLPLLKTEFEADKHIVYYGAAPYSDVDEFEHWKFRTNDDPTVDERFGDPVECGFDELNSTYTTCQKNLKSRKVTHIVMYCLMAFEFVIIMATLAIFTLCIFKQRKRRKRHHEKKKNKKHKKDKGAAKSEDPAASTNNASSTKNDEKQ